MTTPSFKSLLNNFLFKYICMGFEGSFWRRNTMANFEVKVSGKGLMNVWTFLKSDECNGCIFAKQTHRIFEKTAESKVDYFLTVCGK